MKKLFTVLSVFLSLSLFSQAEYYGTVTYKAISKGILSGSGENQIDIIKAADEQLSKFNYILNFNNAESIFYLEETLNTGIDIVSAKIAKNIVGGSFYINKKDSVYLEKKEKYNETFVIEIERPDNYAWKIENETKKINQFTVIKAVKTKRINATKGPIDILITAWFAPEIPVSFGPKDHFGLPGLILELDDQFYHFIAKKITLNKGNKPEISAFEGKRYSEAEYLDAISSSSIMLMYKKKKRN